MSNLKELLGHGQSVWLDYIRRKFVSGGELERLIDEGLRGVTSNPSIFEKAIVESDDYTESLRRLDEEGVRDPMAAYERLAIPDIQAAAGLFQRVYQESRGVDGYVSLEVSPRLARDTARTIEEARRLWKLVDRPNVMIKVPATAEGIPAIRQLISEGVNVNVTLLFSPAVYEQVAEAFIEGLERRATGGGDISRVASVASFFVSRIDSAVDPLLAKSEGGRSLMGKVAIANAKIAYEGYRRLVGTNRWQALETKGGALRQRLLWGSTSTKDPNYRDVMYVEELIGPETVNTVPPATLAAFQEHGQARNSLEEDPAEAHRVMDRLAALGIDFSRITDQLVDQGVKSFADSFDKLIDVLDARQKKVMGAPGLHMP